MNVAIKSFTIENYFISCGIYLYSFIIIPILIHQFKYFFKFSELILYLFSSFIELSFVFSFLYILFYLIKRNIKLLKHLYCLSFCILFISYFIQGISFYISGEFLSVLAIENMHEYKYHLYNWTYFIVSIFFVVLLINACLLFFVKRIEIKEKINIKIVIFCLLCFCILCTHTVRCYSPAISLVNNCLEVFSLKNNISKKLSLEDFLSNKSNKEYPFLKNSVYDNDKYFKKDINTPNVIIIFIEGISTKFVGCYENNFENITPNIDKFASNENTCKFDNYYNHTAATFRGIIGTLSSAYPYYGGYKNGVGWEENNNSDIYKQIKYSSLPKILNKFGYKSIMFSPHVNKSAFDNMIRMLGFSEIFSAQRNSEELLGTYQYFDEYALSDKGIFLSLKQYLAKHENEESTKFICLYNIGSHALKDIDKTGKKYGDGNNKILNRIHNVDYELGQILDYFYASSYAKNTYLIITTDHCTYSEPAYKELFSKEPIYCFMDRIPLLIYSPFKNLPKNIDANFRTSLDFAPTILNLLDIKNAENSFLGYSLFDLNPYNISIGMYGTSSDSIIVQIKGTRYFVKNIPKKYFNETESYLKLIKTYQRYEQNNKLFPE